MATDELEKT